MKENNLELYIRPESVAVIGASGRKGSIGNTTIKNFKDLDFTGEVYAVNPRYDEVEGFPCYTSLSLIPGKVDVALIAVASHLVESAIYDCIEKKVKFVIIFSSGFAEKGKEGLDKQNEILQLCKANGIRVVGPNTLGAFNIKDKIFLSFTPPSVEMVSGDVGIVSQSGATGGIIMSLGMEEKIGFSYTLTTGNQMDLNTLDFMEFLIKDENTEIISSYMEAVPDGKQLRELADLALSKHKPIVMLKSGHSRAGQKAALSHTASLTGSNKVFEMVSNQHGITLVDGLDDMIDAIKVFRSGKRPKGNKVASVVISGATGIMLADKLEDYGLEMASLSEDTQKRLLEEVPEYCSVSNPVDIGQTMLDKPIIYKHCIETLVESEEVDIIMLHLPVGMTNFANDIIDVSKVTDKPIIVMHTNPEQMIGDVRRILTDHFVPAYNSIGSAANAANYLLSYEKAYVNQNFSDETTVKVNDAIQFNGPLVTEPKVKKMLNQAGISIPNGVLVKELNELKEKTSHLTYPFVAKIVSAEITHKSDAGGVVLSINNETSLEKAYGDIIANAKKYSPNAEIKGVLVEEMIDENYLEAFIGVKKDPVFGPIILCGLGGIYVEVMKDVSQRLAPVSNQEAMEMIQELKSYPLFKGFRNGLTYDTEAFAHAIVKISELAISMEGSWTELEINPLIVFEDGQGTMALDGLVTSEQKKTEIEHA